MDFVTILLVIAGLSALVGILAKLLGGLENVFTTLLSLVVYGLIFGALLTGIMFLATFFGFTSDMQIFGIHPFWVAFIPATIYEIYLCIRARC